MENHVQKFTKHPQSELPWLRCVTVRGVFFKITEVSSNGKGTLETVTSVLVITEPTIEVDGVPDLTMGLFSSSNKFILGLKFQNVNYIMM